MYKCLRIILFFYLFPTLNCIANINTGISGKKLITGETLHYKAKWGLLTIGTASTKTDKKLYKIGSKICYKIDLNGKTNGLAKLFYLNDKWTSYIDIQTFTTLKSFRSIHEGGYKLEEIVYFDAANDKARVHEYDFNKKLYVLKTIYLTPVNIRDVVAGFMLIRLIDFTKFSSGDKFSIDGFYKKDGYKIDLNFYGKDYLKTDKGKILCYKINPTVPKSRVFDGLDAVTVWISSDKSQKIVRIKANLVLGEIIIELQ